MTEQPMQPLASDEPAEVSAPATTTKMAAPLFPKLLLSFALGGIIVGVIVAVLLSMGVNDKKVDDSKDQAQEETTDEPEVEATPSQTPTPTMANLIRQNEGTSVKADTNFASFYTNMFEDADFLLTVKNTDLDILTIWKSSQQTEIGQSLVELLIKKPLDLFSLMYMICRMIIIEPINLYAHTEQVASTKRIEF
ncbi:MAG: hypothetical protein UZ20_WS6002000032 [candidate division WS6 bacterium OLB21]|uniref:Uncharacterized protein n=1 Tax=candidate division WS6 bacterium OLB21 TaxID=1617427 RepID=A0A136KLE1_9BACT|nr:MAG: hypothetical protein UZ20_WS6002000032 [candidate division WS6 bacterium OLB21]